MNQNRSKLHIIIDNREQKIKKKLTFEKYPFISYENLELGKKNNNSKIKWDIEELFDLFPNLKNRIDVLGGVLSGGEQQMLTICRSLMGCPKLMMIDEPTEGLSPQMVGNVEKLLKKIAEKGVSILFNTCKCDQTKHRHNYSKRSFCQEE